jgi:predicted nucleic acid-binding protein
VQSVLVDAGPLIALADRSDKHHRRVTAFMRRYSGRLLTTWPVLAETCHFLPERVQIELLRWADAGGLNVIELHESALAVLAGWKQQYLDLPLDLADASLIWVAQHTGVLDILTIDLRDFSVYRLPNGKALKPVALQSPR